MYDFQYDLENTAVSNEMTLIYPYGELKDIVDRLKNDSFVSDFDSTKAFEAIEEILIRQQEVINALVKDRLYEKNKKSFIKRLFKK